MPSHGTTEYLPMTTTIASLLNDLYAALTSHEPTAGGEFTGLVLDTVQATLPPAQQAAYPDALRAFTILHHEDLVALLRDYGPHSELGRMGEYQIVSTPAMIAVCERLTSKPMWMHAVWEQRWESTTPLDDLAAAWAA
jgi:hypothetical protein